MSRFRHQQRQARTRSVPVPPLVEFPPTMLQDSFLHFAKRQFPSMELDSPQYRCLQRAWYFGVLFYHGIVDAVALLPSSSSIPILRGVEQQLESYIASITKPTTQANPNEPATANTTDSGTDSGSNQQATDNLGEQDSGQQEQRGGEDASGTRDA